LTEGERERAEWWREGEEGEEMMRKACPSETKKNDFKSSDEEKREQVNMETK
jgi:hypothetical protein